MQTSDSIVIIPTYNEKENIENIIRAVFGLEKCFHILIIEDNSPDGTADIVRRLQQEFPERLFMIERKGKLGLGTAYITGFKWAIEHGYDYIFEMDADFSHNPNDLPRRRGGCGHRFALHQRSKRRKLADGTGPDVLFRFEIRAHRHRTAHPRHDRRIQMLPAQGAGDHPAGQNQIQRLCLPDRDEVHRLQVRIQGRGSARHLHQPRTGNLENEFQHLRRSRLRSDAAEMGQLVQEIPAPAELKH